MNHVAIAMRCRELRDDSDEINVGDDGNESRNNSDEMRNNRDSKEREVIAKQNLLATTPNSSYSG